ncbi:aminotransferase [Zavarzinia sp. CC-PAN008]|uniref:aminotransferase n=1 Tax=Zavarzinia sp. CC-PAN008 TaxID=3243332 RepID=UPI003F749844
MERTAAGAGHNRAFDAAQVHADDKAHVIHPWAHFESFHRDGSMVMARGEGAHVWDGNGKRYIDGIGGLWCMNLGYGNAEMADAIAAQARELAYFTPFVDVTTAPAATLARMLADRAPAGLSRVQFSNSGSDANESAARLAHYYHRRRGEPERRRFLSRVDAYHGSTFLAMSLTGKPADKSPDFAYATEYVHHLSSPYVYRRPEGMTEAEFCDHLVNEMAETIERLGPKTIAAFFAEPILGSGGVLEPPAGYHRRTLDLCRQHGILYISDEVVTAFGRLGHWFASEEVFGIVPDMIVSAKGISSGYVPLAATIVSDAVYDGMVGANPDAWLTNGFTYSGHPVACVAGIKTIEIMERLDILGHVQRVGPYFEERLRSLADEPIVGDVRGRKFMLCTEYVADKERRTPFTPGINIGRRIADAAEAQGVIVRPLEHLNILSPPLILTRDEIDELVEGLRGAVRATADALVREGVRLG